MTVVEPRPTNPAGPRHLVAGTVRQRLEHLAVALALAPHVVVLGCCAALVLIGDVLIGAAFALCYVAAFVVTAEGRQVLAWTFHRCRWWFDARAVGLALNAERTLFRADAGADDDEHRVVAPWLRRLELTDTGRVYTVRPLPGQTPAEYASATSRMATLWNAAAVEVEHTPGDRFVRIIVVLGMPPAARWER